MKTLKLEKISVASIASIASCYYTIFFWLRIPGQDSLQHNTYVLGPSRFGRQVFVYWIIAGIINDIHQDNEGAIPNKMNTVSSFVC